jgi:hypothetical protein
MDMPDGELGGQVDVEFAVLAASPVGLTDSPRELKAVSPGNSIEADFGGRLVEGVPRPLKGDGVVRDSVWPGRSMKTVSQEASILVRPQNRRVKQTLQKGDRMGTSPPFWKEIGIILFRQRQAIPSAKSA